MAIGLAAGLFGVFLMRGLLASLLFDVSPNNPAVLCAVTSGLIAMALLACYIPARRAAHIKMGADSCRKQLV